SGQLTYLTLPAANPSTLAGGKSVTVNDAKGNPLVTMTDVNQTVNPSGTIVGSRPWQIVGQVEVTAAGTLRVQLTNAGSRNFAPDVVRIERIDPTNTSGSAVLPDLKVLDVTGDPLNNNSLDVWVPTLQQRSVQVNYDPDSGHILFNPISPTIASPINLL